MPPIVLPHNFTPREYQLPILSALDGGIKRAVAVWHRRSGKDKTLWNFMIKRAFERIGNYYYFFPTYAQAKKAIWLNKDRDGFPYLKHIPQQLIKGEPNNTDMLIQFLNGSLIQLIGTENIDSVMSTNPVGCVFSEYALQNPDGWNFVRPILLENDGWAVFDYTPRGKNHGWDLYLMAKENPEWYCDLLTVEDTFGHGGTIGPDKIAAERHSGMSENLIQQEYFVSFEAAVEHAVFGPQLWAARNENRVCNVPWIKDLAVNTYWDIGWNDATSIWFEQTVHGEVHLIDHYEMRQASLDHYLKMLKDKPYLYGAHYMPHDAGYKQMATGKSTQEIGWELGIDFEIVPKLSEEDQINAARMLFNRCWFDEAKCAKGIDSLASYHFEWDTEKRILGATPLHDWSSHASKAFELMAVAHRDEIEYKKRDRYAKKTKQHRSFMAA